VEGLLLIVLAVMVTATAVVGKRLERAVVADTLRRITGTTAVYVDDVLESVLKKSGSTEAGSLSSDTIAELDRSLEQMTARADIVGLKIWSPEGRVLYSEDPSLIGRFYPEVRGEPRDAWGGSVTWRVSTLEGAEHALLRQSWDRLLEVFTPLQVTDVPGVDAVVEFYYPLDSIDTVVAATKRSTWFFMIGIAFPMYLVLAVAIRRTSKTIWRQQDELRNQVVKLSALLNDNRVLHDKLRAAAVHGTEMNEAYRRRFSSELHDGPVQHIGYALLRLDAVSACFSERCAEMPNDCECSRQLERIRQALQAGMSELRQLSSGLSGVDFDDTSFGKVITRAVGQHIRQTKTDVALDVRHLPDEAPLAVKITAYRFIQESLNNAFQHGGGAGQHVGVEGNGDSVVIAVSDEGPGFEMTDAFTRDTCLGLRGLRDRINILGGEFEVDSHRGLGTKLTARLPLNGTDTDYAP